MAAPTNTANVKKALANREPSTHGTSRTWCDIRAAAGQDREADMSAASCPARGVKVAHLYHPDLMIEITATAEIPRQRFREP